MKLGLFSGRAPCGHKPSLSKELEKERGSCEYELMNKLHGALGP